jgi:alpha-glucoside transport system substrate-binding protein
VLAVGAVACGDDDDGDGVADGSLDGQSVDVLGIWGDEELTSFEALVAPWATATGGEMAFIGDREITAILNTRVEGGNPPDVALPAEVGLFQNFARDGLLTPLSSCSGLEDVVRDNYPQGFIDLGTVDGTLYGFFMKADTKATVWYNPGFFDANGYEPLTSGSSFDDLTALSDDILGDGVVPPWSNGQFANGGTGFPGTDTIQQILLNEAGGDVYDGVIDGSVPFTDPAMQDAWEKFGQLALTDGYVVQGGAEGINATAFADATFPPFEDPPTAAMNHLGGFASGFITDQFPDAVAGDDYDFFPWPGGAVTGGATIVYAFNDDDATCSFMSHLASADAQQVWVDIGGFTSVNQQVGLDSYPDPVARAQAEQLTQADAFRFDLDDAIGGALQTAFFQGVQDYLGDQDSLDSILEGIEAARE